MSCEAAFLLVRIERIVEQLAKVFGLLQLGYAQIPFDQVTNLGFLV
jgi:hypothetical protein